MQDYSLVEQQLERGNKKASEIHTAKYIKLKEIVGL
jgi:hypothetical protein